MGADPAGRTRHVAGKKQQNPPDRERRMIVSAQQNPDVFTALRGRVTHAAPLAPQTWFRVGGQAETLFRPADTDDLCTLQRRVSNLVPMTIIGAASNLIIRDGGLPGITVKLGRGFNEITTDGDGMIAGAAALDATVAEHAAQAGLAGLEFLCGIPGTIGGAIAMNAGAYGSDIASVLDWVELALDGDIVRLEVSRLSLSYRHAALPPGCAVVRARLRTRPGNTADIIARMQDIRAARDAAQPVRARTGGSTFRNPDGQKAWELIDAAGCRGLSRGGAQVSEKHCNFLLNTGEATAADLEGLGEEIRQRVKSSCGMTLHWEIKRIGIPLHQPECHS
ncbi:UDP-N-acetylenolpyruvoylglucosamine reductase [Granulibacter bethesdensis CGDNIH4]|nr:UDP-N-acetylenolpyruvoylglucosamine reductase [Granulibacter bethesdensis CGDNIH4]